MSDELDFRMTDLEEQLSSPNGAEVQSQLLEKLSASGKAIAQMIDTGLPTEDFEKARKTHQALAAAHEIISIFPVEKPE